MPSYHDAGTIRYEIKKNKAECVQLMRALTVALSLIVDNTDDHINARQTLSFMLLDILPTEENIK